MNKAKYQICTFCVMDTSDPDITFNSDGECNHCINAREVLLKEWLPNEKGKKLLETTIKEIKSAKKSSKYDCIVGMSGGVDSSFLLHFIKKEMKLNPLVIHVDAGWNSQQALHNIRALTSKLDLELEEHKVNWEEVKELQLAYLHSGLPNQDVPQDHAFFGKLYQIAKQYNVKYVLTGANLSSESILPTAWGQVAMDGRQVKAINKKFGRGELKDFPVVSFFTQYFYYPYIYRMKVITPLNWIDYDKNKVIEFLQEEYGWKYYGGKHHESHWTKFFQSYYLPKKLGFDKRKAHLSSLIVAGQITRDEALKELEKPSYDENEIQKDKIFVASRLEISLEELESFLNIPLSKYTDFPNQYTFVKYLKPIKLALNKIINRNS